MYIHVLYIDASFCVAACWRYLHFKVPSFVRVFREGGLEEQALQAFAWLLLELITLPDEKAACLQLASEDRVQKAFLDSPVVEIRTLGHRIKHVVSTVSTTQRKLYFRVHIRHQGLRFEKIAGPMLDGSHGISPELFGE
jgi:hypothetical protein